ncbi:MULTISPECIES: chromosome segregation protein SMC [Clostridium]|uniref:Chromosome partition protein Smc n=1 Tax=Clostridium botulinum TaxID=1491 RepID=A0A6B4JLD1_CLOBO|nr:MULTISPECIES: chromosome segregation protein SMC [Clostridium]EES50723.1 chromosome segregation protein SMC [Clostridium botulinum E1 str. 'BoNT E Beluga']MBN1048179.1 chromosome segregation protein SMC [Clostridium botulinum]MBN1070662.1 chromosome segregation protein SMC [Clostridium botulinum]MBY6760755.1 chromosome segregation protein SMC [Clostridium botulinum]MBY6919953.1 chromosome segregation protein SMC [Clostridium botulinum]
MFLKSLDIRGFKSFADKTELKFNNGVTAVVGPNGSGKSNISDAVRWVLGEQSVKTLRGGKMEDVIFAGTQYRKPVGLAQVSLTLENSDKKLSTEYSEVTVSRRIFRSGESEYLINNKKCRLKDVINLFMDTGIGKEGYSLIGQGKIESILSGRPEERRALLEEAAGIVKFKSRKEEAEKKLDNTDGNLVRIRDIISTYSERIEPLRIDKEKALQFNLISEDLRKNEVSLLVKYIKIKENELKEFDNELRNKNTFIDEKKRELDLLREKLKSLEEKINLLEKETEEEKTYYYKLKELISEDSKDIELNKERIRNLKEKISKNDKEIEGLILKIKEVEEAKINLSVYLKNYLKDQQEKNEIIVNLEKIKLTLLKEQEEMEKELSKLKEDEFELLRNNSETKNAITLINKEILLKEEKKAELEKSYEFIKHNVAINGVTYQNLLNKIMSDKKDISSLEEEISRDKSAMALLMTKLTNKQKELTNLNNLVTKLEANKNILENLEKQYEGYNRSVKYLMEAINKGLINNVKNTKILGEIFNVDKEYEIAIEIALGSIISNIITENEENAKKLIKYLKDHRLGRATFLPLNIIKGKKLILDNNITEIEGYLGIASEIVSYESTYTNILDHVLGRTIIAKDMNSALQIAKKGNYRYKIVTLEGEVISPGGALTGGSIYAKHSNVLGRKREIEEILLKSDTTKKSCIIVEKEILAIREDAKKLDEEILNKRDEVHYKNIEITKKQGEAERLKNDTNKFRDNLEITKNEFQRVEKDIDKLNSDLENKKSEIKVIEDKNTFNKDRYLKFEESIKEKNNQIDETTNKITDIKINKATLDETIQNEKNQFIRLEKELNELRVKEKALLIENNKSNENLINLENDIKSKLTATNENNVKIEALEKQLKYKELEKEKLKESSLKEDNLITNMFEMINLKERDINKQEVIKAKKEMEKDNYYKKLNEELELTYVEALDIAEDIENEEEIKELTKKLKMKITALGTVNLASIQEYEEVKEKFDFMSSQEKDLECAKEELNSVIQEMTIKIKDLFKENFKVLNKTFNETFRELFKGGSAELILCDGDELTANIDINVEPPGKKLQNINLLSGGEKVLSAIALLFSILKMKPTPFCILDEIEAALDDANVYRYAEFLTKFSKNTQFIVITHRKGTMEVSDRIYGVTMEEKGVSKVVSVDLTAS